MTNKAGNSALEEHSIDELHNKTKYASSFVHRRDFAYYNEFCQDEHMYQ